MNRSSRELVCNVDIRYSLNCFCRGFSIQYIDFGDRFQICIKKKRIYIYLKMREKKSMIKYSNKKERKNEIIIIIMMMMEEEPFVQLNNKIYSSLFSCLLSTFCNGFYSHPSIMNCTNQSIYPEGKRFRIFLLPHSYIYV